MKIPVLDYNKMPKHNTLLFTVYFDMINNEFNIMIKLKATDENRYVTKSCTELLMILILIVMQDIVNTFQDRVLQD